MHQGRHCLGAREQVEILNLLELICSKPVDETGFSDFLFLKDFVSLFVIFFHSKIQSSTCLLRLLHAGAPLVQMDKKSKILVAPVCIISRGGKKLFEVTSCKQAIHFSH